MIRTSNRISERKSRIKSELEAEESLTQNKKAKATPKSNQTKATPKTNQTKATPKSNETKATPKTNQTKATPQTKRAKTTPKQENVTFETVTLRLSPSVYKKWQDVKDGHSSSTDAEIAGLLLEW